MPESPLACRGEFHFIDKAFQSNICSHFPGALSSFPAGNLFNDVLTKVNILVIFPSSCSQFFALYSSQTQKPFAAEFKIGGKRL
jgi:hypothetical protein